MRGRSQKELKGEFLRFICQTSSQPMGLEVTRAEGCHIFDLNGNQYLDFISGIGVANVGHTNPDVVKAITNQAARYLHTMVYGEFVLEPQVRLAQQLAEFTPPSLSVTYFTNSGTEANEGAIKTAKKYTGRKKLFAFDGGFHGDTQGSLSVTGRSVYRKPFRPLLPDIFFLPFNRLAPLKKIDRRTAAVIVEPIQSEGGVNLPDDDFLPALRRRCDETGALLIFDEVMTGMGRTGRLFAFEHWNVLPDILVLAKALGGGMPLGAFMSRPEIMKTLSRNPPLSHVTTFGGHPVCCAAGIAALNYMLDHKLPDRARRLGEYLKDRLMHISGTGGVKDVRGKGLLVGLELDNPETTKTFVMNCRKAGLILGWTLHSETVVRLAPPLVISEAQIDQAVEIIRNALPRARKR